MYDLSVTNEVEVHADSTGKARKIRRWVFKNHTRGALDLTGWRIWFDTLDLNAQVESAIDSQGKDLAHWECAAPGGGLRVTCDFDGFLPYGESYWIQVDYDEPEYFVGLHPSGCWIVNDWFARSEPLRADPYIVQEPQRYSIGLHIPDIRHSLLWCFQASVPLRLCLSAGCVLRAARRSVSSRCRYTLVLARSRCPRRRCTAARSLEPRNTTVAIV